ncbi:MAG TPA: polysaccharide pyruvyl transferase family protein [Amaricoccus sp.]|nr:polysaccharide pyruvyl transferase family protein [Amaricoccus sp.]
MTAPRSVGVLTFHRCINYGSYWQARCLVEGLRQRGLDAEIVDHRSARVNRAEWRCALSPQLPAPTPPGDRAAYARKARRFLAAFERLPLSPPVCLEQPGAADPYDLVLVGSDEVWNLRHPWYGGQPLFYGAGAPGRRLAAYAASFGNQPATDRLDSGRAGLLGRFEAISVRDDNSRALVREALGRDPDLVLDPCLQFPPEAPAGPGEFQDSVVVYGHSFPEWFQAGVRTAARAAGRRIVSFGYRNDWADEQRLDAGPEAFPAAIAGAAAVATTFFHGCVFALLHGRPFVAATSDYRANKVRSLLSLVGAGDRLADGRTPPPAFRAALAAPPAPAVGARIAALRARSDAWLDHALG